MNMIAIKTHTLNIPIMRNTTIIQINTHIITKITIQSTMTIFSNENQMDHQQILIMTTTLIHNRHKESPRK